MIIIMIIQIKNIYLTKQFRVNVHKADRFRKHKHYKSQEMG